LEALSRPERFASYRDSFLQPKNRFLTVAAPNEAYRRTPSHDRAGAAVIFWPQLRQFSATNASSVRKRSSGEALSLNGTTREFKAMGTSALRPLHSSVVVIR
jgi:hypothetical protein